MVNVAHQVGEAVVEAKIFSVSDTSGGDEGSKGLKGAKGGESWYNDFPSGFIAYNTSYVIKVTCDTGFYHEIVSSSPES